MYVPSVFAISQPNLNGIAWTGFFPVVDRLGPVFKGPVAVPKYLERSRPVAVASCLVLR